MATTLELPRKSNYFHGRHGNKIILVIEAIMEILNSHFRSSATAPLIPLLVRIFRTNLKFQSHNPELVELKDVKLVSWKWKIQSLYSIFINPNNHNESQILQK